MKMLGLFAVVTSFLVSCSADCQLNFFNTCAKRHAVYEQTDVVTAGLRHAECGAVQAAVDCMTKSKCSGDIADALRYTVLQFAASCKKVDLCPHLQYGELKRMAQRLSDSFDVPDLEQIKVDLPCAKSTVKTCYGEYTQEIMTHHNVCSQMHKSIQCYENSLQSCKSAFIGAYVTVLRKLLGHITHIAEKYLSMCTV